jgi:arylsulfatase A-like enzyme
LANGRHTNLNLYPPASAAALFALCAIDLWDKPQTKKVVVLLLIAGLALPLGALNGALWQAAFSLTRPLRVRWRAALWLLIGLAATVWLSLSLGAFSRIGGRYHQLAIAVIASGLCWTLLVTSLIAGMQPTNRYPLGFLAQRGWIVRSIVFVALVLIAFVLATVDLVVYPDLYDTAHFVLRISVLWLVMFAIILIVRRLPSIPYLASSLGAICAILFFVSLHTITESQPRVIDRLVNYTWPRTVLYTMREILDFDRDGYSPFLAGGDCNDFSSRINPQARDIPGNGIDENCFMGDAVPSSRNRDSTVSFRGPSPLNIVLITVDALVPGRMGVYEREFREHGKNTTPNIDKWAENAVVFHKVYTVGGWTSIAIGSMMYGVYPRHLKWTRYYETDSYTMVRRQQKDRLPDDEKIVKLFPFVSPSSGAPISEYLQRRGMTTVAVVDDEFTEVFSPSVGIDRGFEHYYEADHLPEHLRNDRGVAQQAIEVLRSLDKTKRFFLWVHFFGPHGPDRIHPGIRLDGSSVQDRYDHEVRYTDKYLGRLLGELKRYESNTAIFVAADHGEVFTRRAHFHGQSLAEDGIRVPLLIRVPTGKNLHVFELVSLIDLVPTILDLTETRASKKLDGLSLKRLIDEPLARRVPRILIAETWRYGKSGDLFLDQIAAFDGRYKVVYDRINQSFLRYSQLAPTGRPQMLGPNSRDRLKAFLGRYVESTGGALDLSD